MHKSLVDRFDRQITYLRLSVTDRCNLRCRYCMPSSGIDSMSHDDILSYEEMERVIAAAADLGVKKIRITGGEPLVRKGLTSFIAKLRKDFPTLELALTTNGILLKSLAGELKEAGLNRVNISLDSLRPDRFQYMARAGSLQDVLDGIEAAEKAGFDPIKLNVVPIMGFNDDEIVDLANLTLSHKWEVRFIEHMPITSQMTFGNDDFLSAGDILKKILTLGKLDPITSQQGNGPASLFRLSGAQGNIGVIPAVTNHFCGGCNRLRLTADGRLKPCLFHQDEFDLRSVLRSGAGVEEIRQELIRAVNSKPQRHGIGEGETGNTRSMNSIGG